MKLDVFKKLIKEAVREAVREELAVVLSERITPAKTQVHQVTKYENYKPVVPRQIPTGDPIMDMLNETRASMTQEEYRDMTSMTSDMVNTSINPSQQYRQGPEPGIDLSTLDFVKNAGAIYRASVEKDKARLGI
jgi:hypothetical protein